MSGPEVELLKKYLKQASRYFEYGCGGSTVLAESFDNIKQIVSVESSGQWIESVKNRLITDKVKFHFVDINAGAWGAPIDKSKIDNWKGYSSEIAAHRNKFDLCLVDGRFRVACCLKAYSKLKDSGFLLVHDYTRPCYHDVEEVYEKIEQAESLAAFKKIPGRQSVIEAIYDKYKFNYQ